MPKMGVVFFDCEVNSLKKLRDIGAVTRSGSRMHSSRLKDFQNFVKEHATILAGHNICNFDIELISSFIDVSTFPKIDTLYLSALLFPQKRFHALMKDELLFSTEISNPLSDALKARDLFELEVEAFWELSDDVRQILCDLLCNEEPFKGFFQYLGLSSSSEDSLEGRIVSAFSSKICKNAPIKRWINEEPLGLAFVLALLASKCEVSVFPQWVIRTLPCVQSILDSLCTTPCNQECDYCKQHFSALIGLKRWFDYDAFRTYGNNEPLQEEAVNAALRGDSLLAIFPTGGGKSLTFQLPAFMTGACSRGLTVVISPLQSLMKDQVDQLQSKGINLSATLNGLLNPLERKDVLDRIREGSVRLLYISPEQLRSPTVFKILSSRHIERFVIDEAHCFSAWGHDFRVDYLFIASFLKDIAKEQGRTQSIPVSCFTATAKQKVIQDICDYFHSQLGLTLKLYTTEASRTNLRYQVIHVKGEDEKYSRLRELLETRSCPTIVYVSTTKKTEEIAEKLKIDGFSSCAYHGKMDPDRKIEAQDDFIHDRVAVMVATNAFGMGVDKPDVGLVVHFDISSSLENYVQESGRAGRDPKLQAECVLFFFEDDLQDQFQLLSHSKLTLSDIQKVWQAVKRRTKPPRQMKLTVSALELLSDIDAGGVTDLSENAGTRSEKETQVRTALSVLENAGYLKRKLNAPRIYADSIRVNNLDEAIEKIQKSSLFPSQEKQDLAKRIAQSLIGAAHRKLGESKGSRTDAMAEELGLKHSEVIEIVRLLREADVVSDELDIVAWYKQSRSHFKTLEKIAEVERHLIRYLPSELSNSNHTVSVKSINAKLNSLGLKPVPTPILQLILKQWRREGMVRSKSVAHNLYHIEFGKNIELLREKSQERLELCGFLLSYFKEIGTDLSASENKDSDVLEVKFSVLGLLKQFLNRGLQTFKPTQHQIEKTLLFLSDLKVIRIESGFLVSYPAMHIERLVQDNKRRFTKADYKQLDEFYKLKIQQIHIVGEYANLMVKDEKAALKFVHDYFFMHYKGFIKKYFSDHREKEIQTNMTPKMYARVYEDLSEVQKEIVNDRSTFITVCAGPGSGKTKVLVHKLASLLLDEDVKSEELLMLTFSRAAATEFAIRLKKLIGKRARFVEIRTFHSFCFEILGREGRLEDSQTVVADAVAAIKAGEVEASRLAKTVLVLDEAQDMDVHEFALVEALHEANESMRIIAVGDDDQNIYEFRGSSSDYFKSLMTKYESMRYELSDNYRSSPAIVALANDWVSRIPKRLKEREGRAVREQIGHVIVTAHTNSEVAGAAVESFLNERPGGRTAILTKTNEEAGEVYGRLLQSRIKARLIQRDSMIRPINIYELRRVFNYLKKRLKDGYVISDELWGQMLIKFERNCSSSSAYSSCLKLLDRFNKAVTGSRYLSDLEEFLWESDIDDGLKDDYVVVSTIHKAKGTEFDNVYLALGQGNITDLAYLREVYVGITRAKTNLSLHYGPSAFSLLRNQSAIHFQRDPRHQKPPEMLHYCLGYRDVKLGEFTTKQTILKNLNSGMPLEVDCMKLFVTENQRKVSIAALSNSTQKMLTGLFERGYRVESAKIRYLAFWHNKEIDQEVLIILPDITFFKALN